MNHQLHFSGRRKFRTVMQSEAAECGLACLAMLTEYHGGDGDLPSLRLRFPASLKGTTLRELIDIASHLNLVARPVQADLSELAQLNLPCIIHWDLDHFVVLRRVHRGRLHISDPARGERAYSMEEASPHFTGIALEATRGPLFKKAKRRPTPSLRSVLGSLRFLTRGLAVVLALALCLEVLALIGPISVQLILDQVLGSSDRELLTVVGLGFCVLIVVQGFLSMARSWTLLRIGTHFNKEWTSKVFAHLLRLPQSYFMQRNLGDIVSRFGAVNAIQQAVTSRSVEVILDGLMSVLTLALMLSFSPILTCVVLVAVAAYIGFRTLYFRSLQEANQDLIGKSAKQQSLFLETVRGVQTLRLNNQTTHHVSRYQSAMVSTLNGTIATQRISILFATLNMTTLSAQRIGVLWIGALLVLNGHLSTGGLMAFSVYTDMFASRTSALVDFLVDLRLLRLQASRLSDIVEAKQEPGRNGTYAGPDPAPWIAVEGVSFSYGRSSDTILQSCTLRINAGECVAIIGPSGSGKSTLVRILTGLLEPTSGRITIGGVSLNHLGKERYRAMCGAVLQDECLFSGTIAENITFFDEDASMDRVVDAAKRAQIHDFISASPMGYRTHIGDMGTLLSGGQQQRIHLARALYRKPQILILDEATSHLDLECEARIASELRQMSMTRIIIAHRPETIASADRVFLVLDGQVRELQPSQDAVEQLPLPPSARPPADSMERNNESVA